jgi:Fe-S cluster assembly protein SufD
MTPADITRQFDARGTELPGPAELATIRREALARFDRLGFPGRSIETWHYTDLGTLAGKTLDYVGQTADEPTLAQAASLLDSLDLMPEAPVCVFVDGHWIESLSRPVTEPGLTIQMLREQPLALLGEGTGESALAALNTAFASDGALIRISARALAPLQLVFIGSGRHLAPQLKLRLELEPEAAATLIQHFATLPEGGEAWLNLVTEIEQDERSKLTLYRLQTQGADAYQTTLTRARLAAEAAFVAGNVELGGKLVRNEFQIELAGTGARADIQGLALTRGRQHCDCRIDIDHCAPQTTSRQGYRAIVSDSSRSVFNGKVTVREDAQHVDARQRNDNLLLSAKAEVDTKPELEIYADQVICSHGATVGELSEDELLYLRTRGIDEETARGILISAFANTVVERLELDSFRSQAKSAVAARLPRLVELG